MRTADAMDFLSCTESVSMKEIMEEGNAIPPPDLARPPWFFGYATLIFSLGFVLWFGYITCSCLVEETINYHRASPILSSHWHHVLWAAVSPQLLFFCAYGSWVGWKFFKHN